MTYTNEELHPLQASLAALDQQDFVMFEQFGKGEAAATGAKQQPFYLAADPVAAFMKALQRTLGVPVTGNWDRATHEALGVWFHNYELTMEIPQEQAQGAPGYQTPIPAWGENPQDTAQGFMENMDVYAEKTPVIIQALGFASEQAMANDSQWLLNKETIGAAIEAHMLAQETAAVTIVPVADCPAGKYKNAAGECVDIPPTVVVRPVVAKVWYKRGSTWLIAGGVLLVGGLLIAAARKG